MSESERQKRHSQLFAERQDWEALWETVYQFVMPERSKFFKGRAETPADVSEHVFDSTAIDAAERLNNLILSGVCPAWMKWARFVPGAAIQDDALKEQLRPLLYTAEEMVFSRLRRSTFYHEMQPAHLDRIVGGTGVLRRAKSPAGYRYACVPLTHVAIQEDHLGTVVACAIRGQWTLREIVRAFGERVPEDWKRQHERDPDTRKHEVCELEALGADDQWLYEMWLKDRGITLDSQVNRRRALLPMRWSKVPGTPYGRGPGMRALSDVRALNKIKELSLKNAAMAVAGVYTVVDDGVINPYTLTVEPGTFLTVASNSPNEPSIAALENNADFNVGMFTMDELRNGIQRVFLADQFQPLGRTPLSATEVVERTRVLAQELGATNARLHQEVLTEVLQGEFDWLAEQGDLPQGLAINGDDVKVEFVSTLSQAQWAMEEQALLSFFEVAMQVGQVDPRAGAVPDFPKMMRRLAQVKGLPPEELRTDEQIDELQEQAAQAQAGNEEVAGGMEPA